MSISLGRWLTVAISCSAWQCGEQLCGCVSVQQSLAADGDEAPRATFQLCLPKVMSHGDRDAIARMCELTDPQRAFFHHWFERYSSASEALWVKERAGLTTLASEAGSLYLATRYSYAFADASQSLIEAERSFASRMRATEDELFHMLQSIVSESQLAGFQRSLDRRSRQWSAAIDLCTPGAKLDISFMLETVLAEVELSEIDGLLGDYERQRTRLASQFATLRDKLRTDGIWMSAEHQSAADQVNGASVARAEELTARLEPLLNKQADMITDLSTLNAETAAKVIASLRPSKRTEMTQEFRRLLYPGLFPDLRDVSPLFDQVMEARQTMSTDTAHAVRHAYSEYVTLYNRICDDLASAYIQWQGDQYRPTTKDDEARYMERATPLFARRWELNARAVNQLQSLLPDPLQGKFKAMFDEYRMGEVDAIDAARRAGFSQ